MGLTKIKEWKVADTNLQSIGVLVAFNGIKQSTGEVKVLTGPS
ncbi:MAG: hypothetical protein WBS33_19165 [Verrucomicrobiia bacterium]